MNGQQEMFQNAANGVPMPKKGIERMRTLMNLLLHTVQSHYKFKGENGLPLNIGIDALANAMIIWAVEFSKGTITKESLMETVDVLYEHNIGWLKAKVKAQQEALSSSA